MEEGLSLKEALEDALDDLDGFYTFAVGTKNGFAVLRDRIACKPAVIAETEDWVGMAQNSGLYRGCQTFLMQMFGSQAQEKFIVGVDNGSN